MTYEEFVTKYLNKKNPNSTEDRQAGMFWTDEAVATNAGVDLAIVLKYKERAQQFNLIMVEKYGRQATEEELMTAPELPEE